MRVMLTLMMLALLLPMPALGQNAPAAREAVPLTVWSQLEGARSIQRRGAGQAGIQVVFDPFCPASANLFRKLEQEHPEALVRWVPVAYYRRDSAAVAHALLAAGTPFQAMAAQFESLSRPDAPRAEPLRPGPQQAVNPEILQSALGLGGYTPMVFSRSDSGAVQLHRGHYDSAIEQALERVGR